MNKSKCFKFRRNPKICKTEHVSQFEFGEEEEKSGYDAKINLAELQIDTDSICFTSPLQVYNQKEDYSISEWNNSEEKNCEIQFSQKKVQKKAPLFNQTSKKTSNNFVNQKKTVYKMNKGKVMGLMEQWKIKKVKNVLSKDPFQEKFQPKIHDRSILSSPFKQTHRIQYLKEIQVLFKDQKNDFERKTSFKSMVVEPKTFYNFEKSLTTEPPSVERLHGIHKSFSNKYDLIFRVHKYKKTPMFSFCEPRQKSVSLESKHLEFMTDT